MQSNRLESEQMTGSGYKLIFTGTEGKTVEDKKKLFLQPETSSKPHVYGGGPMVLWACLSYSCEPCRVHRIIATKIAGHFK